jgi:hypothetical protein
MVPPAVSCTDQMIPPLLAVAVNCWVPPAWTVAVVGEMATVTVTADLEPPHAARPRKSAASRLRL